MKPFDAIADDSALCIRVKIASVRPTVAASAGTQYYDYLATMKRGAAGWTVLKIEAA